MTDLSVADGMFLFSSLAGRRGLFGFAPKPGHIEVSPAFVEAIVRHFDIADAPLYPYELLGARVHVNPRLTGLDMLAVDR